LRGLRDVPDETEFVVLSATDPANPYGATLRWPTFAAAAASAGRGPMRAVGATVILVNGALAAYLARGDRELLAFLPESEPERSKTGQAIGRALIERARTGAGSDVEPRGMLIEEIDGIVPASHPLAPYLAESGFVAGAMGFSPVNPGGLVAGSRDVFDV
jgi:ATP-dependent Lhr-like helicase